MALLHDIQAELLSKECDLSSVLLKLKFLAAKIGSGPLADWVRYEIEGYPPGVELPDYRVIGMHYTGTFSGPFGSGINNAPIPNYLIAKFAGDRWVNYEMRQGVAAIDHLVADNDGGSLHINSADLVLLLQGKIYPDYACNSVTGNFSVAQLREIQNTVKSKILELILELEESIPESASVEVGGAKMTKEVQGQATQIFHQTVFGNMNNVANTGSIGTVKQIFKAGDRSAAIDYLTANGIEGSDAKEIIDIIASEKPTSDDEPLGKNAKHWLAENIGKAVKGLWSAGVTGASEAITTAALAYYGMV